MEKDLSRINRLFALIETEEENGEIYLVVKKDLHLIAEAGFCITSSKGVDIMTKGNFNIDADKINLNSDQTKQVKFLKSLIKEGKLDLTPMLDRLETLENKLKMLEDKVLEDQILEQTDWGC